MSASGNDTGDGAQGSNLDRSLDKIIGDTSTQQAQPASRKRSRDEESLGDDSFQAPPNKRPRIESVNIADVAKYKGRMNLTASSLDIDTFDAITAQYSEDYRRGHGGRPDRGGLSLSITTTSKMGRARSRKLAAQWRREAEAEWEATRGEREIEEVDEDGFPIVIRGKEAAAPAPPSKDTSGGSDQKAATKNNAPPSRRSRDDRRQGGQGGRGGGGQGDRPKPAPKTSKAQLDLEMEEYWAGAKEQ